MERPFGPNTRLYAIRHCRQFRNFRKYVLAPRQFAAFMQVYRLADLRWFYPLHAQDTADAPARVAGYLSDQSERAMRGLVIAAL